MQLIPGVRQLDQAQIDYAHGVLRAFGPAGSVIAALQYDQIAEAERALVARYVADLTSRMKASGAPEDPLVDVLLVAVQFDRSSTDAWNEGAFSAVLVPALRGFAVCGMWWAVQRLCRLIGYISFHGGRTAEWVQGVLDAMENALAPELARWPKSPPRAHPPSPDGGLTIAIVSDYRLADLSGIHYLMRSLEAYHRRFEGQDRIHLVIEQAAITEASAPYRARIQAAGVDIVTYDQSASDPQTPVGFGNLSRVCAALEPDIAVFYCSYCFALLAAWCRLAPKQAYWSTSWDAAPSRQIELVLTLSEPTPVEPPPSTRVGKRVWTAVPPLFAITRHPVEPVRRDGPLARLGRPLFATVGGFQKFQNDAFGGMLARLLSEFPEGAFLCTARPSYRPIRELFERFGIADRCHNIGYVDLDDFAPQIDVHLDGFPYGTGEAAIRMLARGCPTVGMAVKLSMHSFIYHQLMANGFGNPDLQARAQALFFPPGERSRLLIADTIGEYLAFAVAVARDPEYRASCAEAHRTLFEELLADGAYSTEAWRRALVSALEQ